MWKSTGWIAKKEHVTNETIQNWIKEGYYDRVKKTKGGHYRVWVEEPSTVILYARISSKKQQSSLETQERLLKKHYPDGKFISDIASGFNQNRRGYKAILERAIKGNSLHLVATSSDRISRSKFQLIQWVIELSGGKIELLAEKNTTKSFNTKTLIAFITCFINDFYGKNEDSEKQKNTNYPNP